MNTEGEFWVIAGFMVVIFTVLATIFGFMLSMNARMDNMATKDDIVRVEANMATKAEKSDIYEITADIRELRGMLNNKTG